MRKENTKLRKLVTDLSLSKEALQGVISKKRMGLAGVKVAVELLLETLKNERAAGLRADEAGGVDVSPSSVDKRRAVARAVGGAVAGEATVRIPAATPDALHEGAARQPKAGVAGLPGGGTGAEA